jgi:hypothetical protein
VCAKRKKSCRAVRRRRVRLYKICCYPLCVCSVYRGFKPPEKKKKKLLQHKSSPQNSIPVIHLSGRSSSSIKIYTLAVTIPILQLFPPHCPLRGDRARHVKAILIGRSATPAAAPGTYLPLTNLHCGNPTNRNKSLLFQERSFRFG